MILMWKIKYIDRIDRKLKERNLYLDTETLEKNTKCCIEFACQKEKIANDPRAIIPFRSLFTEFNIEDGESIFKKATSFSTIGPHDYFEDDSGNEVSLTELVRIELDKPNAIVIPYAIGWDHIVFPDGITREQSAEFGLGYLFPLQNEDISLSQPQINLLRTFVNDSNELYRTKLNRAPHPFSMRGSNGNYEFILNVSKDDLVAYIVAFRKLYMENEPANFMKASNILANPNVLRHPVRHNISTRRKFAAKFLSNQMSEYSFPGKSFYDFGVNATIGDLIDGVMYTKFIHQPTMHANEKYCNCLKAVKGSAGVLMFMFCSVIHELCDNYTWIAGWASSCLKKVGDDCHSLEEIKYNLSAEEQLRQSFFEKVEDIAEELWISAGRPVSGPRAFKLRAQGILQQKIRE